MGCSNTRFGVEEDRIVSKHLHLGFESQPTDTVVGTIRRYALSMDGQINDKQLNRIQTVLNLTNSTAAEAKAFYSAAVKTTDFLAAAILMSKGTPETKAAALFEIADLGLSLTLEPVAVIDLVGLLTHVAVNIEPTLIQNLVEDDKKYLSKIRGNVDAGIESLKKLVMGKATGPVKKDEFVKNLVGYSNGKLLETGGIREHLSTVKSAS